MSLRRSLIDPGDVRLASLTLGVCLAATALVTQPAGAESTTPVVFVPGVTGTKLRDAASGELVWGSSRPFLRPRDGGYSLALPIELGARTHPQTRYEAAGPILRMRLTAWTKTIYQPLLERLEEEGYRLGRLVDPGPDDDLFVFDHDWRYSNLESVAKLDRALETLSRKRGGIEVDLICQSNAAKMCRWLAKYGASDPAEAGAPPRRGYRIRKVILVGASNNGALRALKMVIEGRRYVPVVGRRFEPEVFFTLRPLFEDLPVGREDLFFDAEGAMLDVDLFEPQTWIDHGWSIFDPEVERRLKRSPRQDLFGAPPERRDYLARQLDGALRFQGLLNQDTPHFPRVRYYRLENASRPTIARALLTREEGQWRTYFLGDKPVDGDPALAKLAAAPGDGHVLLESQRDLSPQETAAVAATKMAPGGHLEAMIGPEGLDAIVGFLRGP